MDDARTVFVGNIAEQVTEELLYELFLQAGPLERVKIPNDREGRKSSFGFITFKHEVSVPYAIQLLNGVRLFEKSLNIKPRMGGSQKDKQQGNQMQRSISYPVEAYNLANHQQNDHKRFDDRGEMGPQHVSFEDLLRMGSMMNIAYNSPENIFTNIGIDYGGSLTHNRNQNDRSNFNDRNRERGRRDDRPTNDYNRNRDRSRDYSSNRNQKRNQDKRNNYDRNNTRRNNRFY